MRREAQQRHEICRYPKHQPCRRQRRPLWAAPTSRCCRGPTATVVVACPAYGADSGARKSAQTRKARSLGESRRLDLPASLTRRMRSSDVKCETIDLWHWGGHPRHLCARQVPASPGFAKRKSLQFHNAWPRCACPIGDIVPVVTAKAGSRAFLLSRIGHPAYI